MRNPRVGGGQEWADGLWKRYLWSVAGQELRHWWPKDLGPGFESRLRCFLAMWP